MWPSSNLPNQIKTFDWFRQVRYVIFKSWRQFSGFQTKSYIKSFFIHFRNKLPIKQSIKPLHLAGCHSQYNYYCDLFRTFQGQAQILHQTVFHLLSKPINYLLNDRETLFIQQDAFCIELLLWWYFQGFSKTKPAFIYHIYKRNHLYYRTVAAPVLEFQIRPCNNGF